MHEDRGNNATSKVRPAIEIGERPQNANGPRAEPVCLYRQRKNISPSGWHGRIHLPGSKTASYHRERSVPRESVPRYRAHATFAADPDTRMLGRGPVSIGPPIN
jgi:hypothetical protein